MKKLSKALVVLAVAATVFTCLFAFAACQEGKPLEGTVTIYVGGSENKYEVNLKEAEMMSNDSVLDALEYLASQDENFTYAGTISGGEYYGAFISSICTLQPDSSQNQYVAFFMSDASKKDVSAYALPDENIDGNTVYYSGYGVSGVKLADGLVVYFKLASY